MRTPLLCALALLCGAGAACAQARPANAPNGPPPGYGPSSQPAPAAPGPAVGPPNAVPAGYAPSYPGGVVYPGYAPSAYECSADEPNAFSDPPVPRGVDPRPPLPPPADGEGPFDAPCGKARFWVSADYMLSWFRSQRLATPLVTTGSTQDIHPGALDQAGTVVLLGGSLDFGAFSGIRASAGLFLDEDDHFALELGGLAVFPGHSTFRAASDASGNPIITRPIFDVRVGREDAFLDAFPGTAAGGVAVDASSKLFGSEVNARYGVCPAEHVRASALVGFRYLRLEDDLAISDQLTPLTNNVFRFQGAFVNPPSTLADLDHFHADNSFYGMQVGGGVNWEGECFFVGAFGKVGFGVTEQKYDINGTTTLITPAGNQSAVGGILALPTNMGQHNHTVFGFVPEVGLNLGVKVTPHVDLTAGYSFLYWNQVARPGDTLDRNVNTSLVPTDVLFGSGVGPAKPAVRFNGDSFWVHSLTFGVDVHF